MATAERPEPAPATLVVDGWREPAHAPETDVAPAGAERSSPRWGVIIALWAIPATIATLQAAAGYALRGAFDREWPWALLQFPRWMSWALVTPLIFTVSRRVPLYRDDANATGAPHGFGRAIAIHAALAVAIVAVMETIWILISFWLERRMNPGSASPAPLIWIYSAILGRLVGGAFTYAAVLGVATTLGYHRRLRDHDRRAAELEAQLALAQVQALKMQVHPHFLFNTLHAVTVLIRDDPATATRMVTRLGDLLRLTLSRATTPEVCFRHELDILRLYLEIERTRFHDRLVIDYDVDPGTLSALVPDLILQPLVENAIKHGVSPNARSGRVLVRAARDDGRLLLEIRDNGRGLPGDYQAREGVGMATTRARLERLYGADHELSFTNAQDGGCVARIRLPLRLAAPGECPGAHGTPTSETA